LLLRRKGTCLINNMVVALDLPTSTGIVDIVVAVAAMQAEHSTALEELVVSRGWLESTVPVLQRIIAEETNFFVICYSILNHLNLSQETIDKPSSKESVENKVVRRVATE
jgi:hypothetical protein